MPPKPIIELPFGRLDNNARARIRWRLPPHHNDATPTSYEVDVSGHPLSPIEVEGTRELVIDTMLGETYSITVTAINVDGGTRSDTELLMIPFGGIVQCSSIILYWSCEMNLTGRNYVGLFPT